MKRKRFVECSFVTGGELGYGRIRIITQQNVREGRVKKRSGGARRSPM